MTTPYDDVRGFVDIDGVSLHYDLSGEPDKPALALVNMASHNLTCWELILDQLLTFAQVLRMRWLLVWHMVLGRLQDLLIAM